MTADKRKCALAGCPVLITIGTQNRHQKYHSEKCRLADKKPWRKPARKAYMRDYMRRYGKKRPTAGEGGVVSSTKEETSMSKPQPADEHAAKELELYVENDGQLYRQMFQPIVKNLANKMAKGEYVPERGVKAFRYLIDEGARKYVKEFGSGERIFTPATREMVARIFERSFRGEWEAGNYREHLTKVAQKRLAERKADATWDNILGRKSAR